MADASPSADQEQATHNSVVLAGYSTVTLVTVLFVCAGGVSYYMYQASKFKSEPNVSDLPSINELLISSSTDPAIVESSTGADNSSTTRPSRGVEIPSAAPSQSATPSKEQSKTQSSSAAASHKLAAYEVGGIMESESAPEGTLMSFEINGGPFKYGDEIPFVVTLPPAPTSTVQFFFRTPDNFYGFLPESYPVSRGFSGDVTGSLYTLFLYPSTGLKDETYGVRAYVEVPCPNQSSNQSFGHTTCFVFLSPWRNITIVGDKSSGYFSTAVFKNGTKIADPTEYITDEVFVKYFSDVFKEGTTTDRTTALRYCASFFEILKGFNFTCTWNGENIVSASKGIWIKYVQSLSD